ncbi:MAG: hypothetical protein Fur0037_12960 [Planctomycetota bacterium]
MAPTPLPADRLRAPQPRGPLSGRRTASRRLFAHGCAALNRFLDILPMGRWFHRHAQRGLRMSRVPLPAGPGREGLVGLRIAFLSDLHAGSFMSERDLERIFALVAGQRPDLVCLGGDMINTREREILLLRRPLGLLKPPLGVFAVPGNHDHFHGRDIGLWSAFLREQGVEVLINEGRRVERDGCALWVCGVDDLTEGEPDLARALDGRREGEMAVLLSHHPDFFFEAAAAGVDLTLSGHTHGGQIRIGSFAPIHHSRFGYERGAYEVEGCRLYVGSGVGVTVLPLRIGAPPEIPIVEVVADGDGRPGAISSSRP